jgi:tetratricopeptide (TPR) repeat protein
VTDCDQALAINPRCPDALRARAKAHREIAAVIETCGEDPGSYYEKALADLDEELVWNPEQAATYAERAVVRLTRSIAGARRSGSEIMKYADGAISDFDKMISLNYLVDTAGPLRAYAFLVKAWILTDIGENPDESLHQATEAFSKALGREVSDVEVHRMIGEIHDRQGRLREAAQAFETGLRVAPGDPDLQELLKDVRDRLRWVT